MDDLAREEEEEAAAAAREAEAEKRAEAEAAAEGGEDVKRVKGESGRERIRRARRGRWWNDGAIELSGPAFATVAHPSAPDMIVAGSWGIHARLVCKFYAGARSSVTETNKRASLSSRNVAWILLNSRYQSPL